MAARRKPAPRRYLRHVPTTIPEGLVLAHGELRERRADDGSVLSWVASAWLQADDGRVVLCDCGWPAAAGRLHYVGWERDRRGQRGTPRVTLPALPSLAREAVSPPGGSG